MNLQNGSEPFSTLSPTRMRLLSQLVSTSRPTPVDLFRRAGMTPDPWQRNVLLSDAPRVLLNCSRQSGKSTVAACLSLFEAVYRAPALILLLSPSLRQSGILFKTISDLYRRLPGMPRTAGDSASRLELRNGSAIISLPGSENTVRGYASVRLLIVDEAAHVEDDLFWSVRPMLAVSGGRFMALSTPYGKRGFFFDAWVSAERWERVEVTAYQCPRITKDFLAREKAEMPKMRFESEYECRFHSAEDSVFDFDDIERTLDDSIEPLFA